MNNKNYEEYLNNILNSNQVNNTKILYKCLVGYNKKIINYNNKSINNFMKDYVTDILDNYYGKKEYSNNSIIYLIKGLIYFMEISELYINFDISDIERSKLDKYVKSNNSEKIVDNKYVKKSKCLEVVLLLEMGLYNLLNYFKIYKNNIHKFTDMFVGNEEKFYEGYALEIEQQLRSIVNSLDAVKNVDNKLNIRVNKDMIDDIKESRIRVKNKLKELL